LADTVVVAFDLLDLVAVVEVVGLVVELLENVEALVLVEDIEELPVAGSVVGMA
jgi:hypothetical protein